jgi:hypothetical protein
MITSSLVRKALGLAAGLVAVGGVLSGGATASATSGPTGGAQTQAFSCVLAWSDKNTAGIKCTGSSFVGWAQCKNGRIVQGAQAASGTISYAYCTSINSSLKTHPVVAGGIPK